MEEEVRRSLLVRLDGMAVRHPDWKYGVGSWGMHLELKGEVPGQRYTFGRALSITGIQRYETSWNHQDCEGRHKDQALRVCGKERSAQVGDGS